MADAWQITIRGGFAWVFDERDKPKSTVTVGPFRKTSADPDYHPHEMVLRVPAGRLDETRTSLPFRRDRGWYVFVLRDRVELKPNDAPEPARGLRRVASRRRPAPDSANWNDFYWIYDADRIREETASSSARLTVRAGFTDDLLAFMQLSGGDLRVQAPRLSGVYRIAVGGREVRQPLATHILYAPDAAADSVVFETPHGRVWALPGKYDIAAECGCPDDPEPGQPVPGFGVTFRLYEAVPEESRFVPVFQGFGSNGPNLDPGPDCPPRGYSI
jgi:hypothetical protein